MWFKCPICDKVLYKTVSSVEEEQEDDVCEDLKYHRKRSTSLRFQTRPAWNRSNTTSAAQANPPVPWVNKVEHKGKTLSKAELKRIKDEASRKAPVVTKCGHVFHKECLYKYMRAYRLKFRESSIECPVCESRVLCAGTYILDLEAHDERGHQADSEISVIRLLHSELVDQTKDISKKLMDVELQIRYIKAKRVLEQAGAYGRPKSRISDDEPENCGHGDRDTNDGLSSAEDEATDLIARSTRFSQLDPSDIPIQHCSSHFSLPLSNRPQSPPPLSSCDSSS